MAEESPVFICPGLYPKVIVACKGLSGAHALFFFLVLLCDYVPQETLTPNVIR